MIRSKNSFFAKYILFVLSITFIGACTNDKKTNLIPVENFFKDPDKSLYYISPDGKYISYLKPVNNRLQIFVQSLESNKVIQITTLKNQSVKKYFWVSNNKIFYLKDNSGDEKYELFSIDRDGKNNRLIQKAGNEKIDVLKQLLTDKDSVLITINERNIENFDVYRLNINTGDRSLVALNPGNIVEWIADKKGQVKLCKGSDGVNETLYYREVEAKPFKPVIVINFKNTLNPIGFSDKPNHIYALSNLGRDKLALVEFDCISAKETSVLYENADADILDVEFSKTTNKLSYATYETAKREVHFFNSEIENLYKDIRAKLPNQEVRIYDRDNREEHFIVRTYTDKNPGAYYIYYKRDKKLKKLSDFNSSINPDMMSEMKTISYKTSDGLTIHGYLTLPKGSKTRNFPCIVLPHSGPALRNTWGYSSEVQFLASRGYAVFQINYRGSSGYGKAFLNSGFKEWGKKIQDDITDGVKFLIKEKVVNPDKIGIYGYSFGGYSALNGAIYHSDIYKCAASYSGLTNLFTYLKGFPAYYKPYQQMLDQMIGNPEIDADYLKYASPVFQIDKIKVPLLIAQGAKDPRVNVNETNQFVKELRKNKIPVNYIVHDDEGHTFRNAENRLLFYKNLESFFAQYLLADK